MKRAPRSVVLLRTACFRTRCLGPLARIGGCAARCGAFESGEELDGGRVSFVGPERPPGEDEVDGRHGEGEGVEARPDGAVGDDGGGDERAVAAVEGAEGGGAVDEVGAEYVVEAEVDCHAQAGREEAVEPFRPVSPGCLL